MIAIRAEVEVGGISARGVYDFMLNCTDEDYQEWWPGTYLAYHTIRRYPNDLGNHVYFDEYVGRRRVKFEGVVVRSIPGKEIMWQMMEKEDSLRKIIESEINQYRLKLRENLRQRKIQQENLAFTFSRISPVSAYQLGAMSLAGTDVNMKKRYEDAINDYRNRFNEYVTQKQDETGDNGRIMMAITLNEDGSQSMSTSRRGNTGTLNLDDIPEFTSPEYSLADALNPTIKDFGLILFFILLAFLAAFISFLRYDVR